MKKVIALVLAFVMVFALCACGGGSDEKVIKIGVYEPQTGANGAGGKQEILGMEYANSVCPTVTIGGVEYKIELVYGDNESNTEKAVSAATKIIPKAYPSFSALTAPLLLSQHPIHSRTQVSPQSA